MKGKNASWFWWAVGVCAVVVVIALVCRSRSPDRFPRFSPRDQRPSLPERIRVSGGIRTGGEPGDAAGGGNDEPLPAMPPAVEHGTASLVTYSEESVPREYVDGRVLFRDGFDEGAAKWAARVLRGPKDGHVVDESGTVGPEDAKVEERDVRGTRSMAAVLRWRRADSCLVITPSVPVGAESFSFEADTYIEADSGMNCLINSAGPSTSVYRDKTFTRDPRKWERIRVEVVRRTDEKSLPYHDTKFLVNGKLVSHMHHYSDQVIPGFVLERGASIVDNVIIREMVPKGTTSAGG